MKSAVLKYVSVCSREQWTPTICFQACITKENWTITIIKMEKKFYYTCTTYITSQTPYENSVNDLLSIRNRHLGKKKDHVVERMFEW